MPSPYAYAAMRECLRQAGEMTPDHPQFLPEMLRAIMRTGMNYTDIAIALGTHRPTISRWMQGDYKPQQATVDSLCRLLVERLGGMHWHGLGEK